VRRQPVAPTTACGSAVRRRPGASGRRMARGPRRLRGFSLLELMAAVTIFLIIAAASMTITDSAADRALEARQARELRFLAEYRLEEIKVFEQEYDDILEGSFEDVDEIYKDYEWELDIRDVVVFGQSTSEDAQYYFDEPDKNEDDEASTTSNQPTGQPEELRELTLRVTAPSEEGNGDSIEIVLLLPTLQ